ncbi:GntR family transcriptional regulator [Sedimentitalea todarodis]|uniref:GntR family transcriptional regulator n=1 Tax=Sedimentitalea todarodis TaxID=1631240 RepID=A0ABU3VDY4_9RHOB|nr:GntR family transcriptional regulator [Sedimentitalea todarodis]MDU9004386.1 GntR family transcriptional regulator [Sedimentitalea todarodis]
MAKEQPILPDEMTPKPRAADTGERVYELLREKAINYELRPGDRVNEVHLAAELNVSRTPVRAALHRLVSEGLLRLVPNKGFFRPSIDIDTIRSLFEMRGAIEVLSVRLFCERATKDDIRTLEDHWRRFQENRGSMSIKAIVDEDEKFHEWIAEGSRNSEALRMLRDLNSRIRFLRLVALGREDCNMVTNVEHGQIISEIKAKNVDAAVSLMSRHISLMLNDVTEIAREAVVKIYLGDET